MLDELEELNEDRLMALDQIQLNKRKVEKAYNNHIQLKCFSECDIAWKSIMPLGAKDLECGKWSPNWEGHLYRLDTTECANWKGPFMVNWILS